MQRKLFNLAAGVSLAVFMATVILWIRGNWQADQVNWLSDSYGVCFSSANSLMAVMFGPEYKGADAANYEFRGWRYGHYSAHANGQDTLRVQIPISKYHRLGWLGFAYDPNHLETDNELPKMVWYGGYRLYFPDWSVAVIAGILPLMWYSRRRQRLRTKLGLCMNCGYDLRATPDRCPECGALPPPRNPPMQWTEPASKLLVVRESARGRLGHRSALRYTATPPLEVQNDCDTFSHAGSSASRPSHCCRSSRSKIGRRNASSRKPPLTRPSHS